MAEATGVFFYVYVLSADDVEGQGTDSTPASPA